MYTASNADPGLESAKTSVAMHAEGSSSCEGLISHRYKLQRQLKNRHVSMIRLVLKGALVFPDTHKVALLVSEVSDFLVQCSLLRLSLTTLSSPIGVIGTGLFLSTATGLANGGPLGLLLSYCVVGSICYSIMVRSRV